jgi:hypothetical protein
MLPRVIHCITLYAAAGEVSVSLNAQTWDRDLGQRSCPNVSIGWGRLAGRWRPGSEGEFFSSAGLRSAGRCEVNDNNFHALNGGRQHVVYAPTAAAGLLDQTCSRPGAAVAGDYLLG